MRILHTYEVYFETDEEDYLDIAEHLQTVTEDLIDAVDNRGFECVKATPKDVRVVFHDNEVKKWEIKEKEAKK